MTGDRAFGVVMDMRGTETLHISAFVSQPRFEFRPPPRPPSPSRHKGHATTQSQQARIPHTNSARILCSWSRAWCFWLHHSVRYWSCARGSQCRSDCVSATFDSYATATLFLTYFIDTVRLNKGEGRRSNRMQKRIKTPTMRQVSSREWCTSKMTKRLIKSTRTSTPGWMSDGESEGTLLMFRLSWFY